MKTRVRPTDQSRPLLERLFLARGEDATSIARPLNLADLLSPTSMKGIDGAADILADAVRSNTPTIVAGDFDADGAGSAAVAIIGLRAMGLTNVDYIIPDRITQGYGLSPAIAEAAAATGAKLLITVDNGISSIEGVKRARSLGLITLLTDHHLAPDVLPDADVIVNPNQPGCSFASKNLSGCGVIFYVLLAARAKLNAAKWFDSSGIPYPNLANLIDLVALSTVGDLVKLDRNNRTLVAHGLRLIRQGRSRPGMNALFQVAGSNPADAMSSHFGFTLCPRLNGAGRIDDMRIGVECLIAGDDQTAMRHAATLNDINQRRRDMQKNMTETAIDLTTAVEVRPGMVLHSPEFHQGIVGLIATKMKDSHYRPTIVFADAEDGKIKGSGRSIPGFHIRDALALIQSMPDSPIITMGGNTRDGLRPFNQEGPS